MSLLACPNPDCAYLNDSGVEQCEECGKKLLPGFVDHGYRTLRMPEHPMAQRSGKLREHRLIAARTHGRLLASSEIVHHINGDQLDNRLENLQVLSSNAEHRRLHRSDAA